MFCYCYIVYISPHICYLPCSTILWNFCPTIELLCFFLLFYLLNRIDDLVCFVFMKPNEALAMVLKSGEGVGSEPVEKNVVRHVYHNFKVHILFFITTIQYCLYASLSWLLLSINAATG